LKIRTEQSQLTRRHAKRDYDVDDVRILAVLAAVYIDPHISTRQIARQTGVPQRTIVRSLRKKKHHPYHVTLTQALTPNDMRQRVLFCQWARQMIAHDADFFKYVLFSDESTFKNTGELNTHNYKAKNVDQMDGAPLHFARNIRHFLDQNFNGRWIGRGDPIAWPPRRFDFT
ncbi:hypothetical protein X777_14482, partial [Ooceraea biroi]